MAITYTGLIVKSYGRFMLFFAVSMISSIFIRLRMTKGKMSEDEREKEVAIMAILFAIGVWVIGASPVLLQTTFVSEEIVVFDSWIEHNKNPKRTIILTNGTGKRIFQGAYNFTDGETYNVTWHFPVFNFNEGVRYGKNVVLDEFKLIQAVSK